MSVFSLWFFVLLSKTWMHRVRLLSHCSWIYVLLFLFQSPLISIVDSWLWKLAWLFSIWPLHPVLLRHQNANPCQRTRQKMTVDVMIGYVIAFSERRRSDIDRQVHCVVIEAAEVSAERLSVRFFSSTNHLKANHSSSGEGERDGRTNTATAIAPVNPSQIPRHLCRSALVYISHHTSLSATFSANLKKNSQLNSVIMYDI